MTLKEFLAARINEMYDTERGDASENSAREVAARVHRNMRLMSLGAWSIRGERMVSTLRAEAVKYADHPDFDPSWAD